MPANSALLWLRSAVTLILLLMLLPELPWINTAVLAETTRESVPVVKGERGQDTWLPCDVDSEHDDSPAKVLWYAPLTAANSSGGERTPFYMVEDTQRRGIWNGQHAIGVHWAGRASFSVSRSPAALRLSRLELSDSGAYLCTVAFHGGAQRNSTVRLVVGVAPSVPIIMTSAGTAVEGTIGPFMVGESLSLVCLVEKGVPVPTVTWRRDGAELMRETDPGSRDLDGVVRSSIVIDTLTRDDLLMELSCETSNIIGGPFEASVLVDLTLPPVSVKILGTHRTFEVDVSAEFRCEVVGSRPPPKVSWWLDEQRLEPFLTEEKANSTTTSLLLVLTARADKATLTCRALNTRLLGEVWEDTLLLNVYHAPHASLSLGQGLHLERIHEGQDVYLECAIRANPWISDVLWTLDGEPLEDVALAAAMQNGSSSASATVLAAPGGPGFTPQPQTHVLLQEQYLVLRNVTSKFTGSYACHVRSARGEAVSNSLDLRVQYAPRCRKGMQEVFRYSTSREELSIPCEMDADPEDLTFHWIMKNNSEVRDLLTFTTNGSRSVARYKPAVATEFVSLVCWANNSVGSQRQPCTYFVEPHGAPKALSGCEVVNQAMTWFFVRCSEDDSEDRPVGQEWYLLEVFHADTGAPLGNVSARGRPVFHVDDIPPATECLALAYAVNERGGRSEPARVVVQAIPPPSKLLTSGAVPSEAKNTAHLLALTVLLLLLRRALLSCTSGCSSKCHYSCLDIR
ncbi:hemicentin-2-like [Dermacentor variabilis]|uniref:hemicentin-2-like n=1 Tax=Dermacentor variabilis TaxID=34621 RepID=UPI003F5B16EE